jgi:rubrerythrin
MDPHCKTLCSYLYNNISGITAIMDISNINDPASARLALELAIEDIVEYTTILADNKASDEQLQGMEAQRQALEGQLEALDEELAASQAQRREDGSEEFDVTNSGMDNSEPRAYTLATTLDNLKLTTKPDYGRNDRTDNDRKKHRGSYSDSDSNSDSTSYQSAADRIPTSTRDRVQCPDCLEEWQEDEQPDVCPTCKIQSNVFVSTKPSFVKLGQPTVRNSS